VELKIDQNDLTGTIPPEIGSIHTLKQLSVSKNKLSGTLPDIFDRLTNLGELVFVRYLCDWLCVVDSY